MKDIDDGFLSDIPQGEAGNNVTDGCLVLEGGAFRGLYTAGVLDAFMKNGLNFSVVIGVSAGALSGVNYVSGQIGRSARINLKYRHDSRYVGMDAQRKAHSIIDVDFAIKDISAEVPFNAKRYHSGMQRFFAVATSLADGKPRYYELGKCDMDAAVKASASMPYISPPVMVDGELCLDGGCSNRVPVDYALQLGAKNIVVVRTRPRDYRKKNRKDKAARLAYSGYPQFSKSLENSRINYNRECDELVELEKKGRIFVVAPAKPVDVKRLEPDVGKLKKLYMDGYEDAMSSMPMLEEYLKRKDGMDEDGDFDRYE